MANYCSNNISAIATDSEWREIATAFKNDQIDWPASMEGTDCDDWAKAISLTTKWSPTPWDEGYMAALSKSYPTVVFHYQTEIEGGYPSPSTWFCNGDNSEKSGVTSARKQALKDEAARFLAATPLAADGIDHRVEIMPDGRVAADGENRFGECNIFSWTKIKAISCGNWHTVGLKKDGTLVACGSNANGQCDIDNIEGRAIAVSCGRYHTAILLDNGKVLIRGKLEQDAQAPSLPQEKELVPADFPLLCDLQLSKYIKGWEKMNDRIENMSPSDDLTLKKISKDGEICFEVLNTRGEKIGEISTDANKSLAKMLTSIKAVVATVTPLSKRRKGAKYAAMTIRIEYNSEPDQGRIKKKASTKVGDYTQTKIESWPAVKLIKSVFDAVIGVTEDGQVLIDGYCPCSEADILKAVGIS